MKILSLSNAHLINLACEQERMALLKNNDLELGMSSWKKHVAQSWALLRPKGNESSKNEKWSKLGKCGAAQGITIKGSGCFQRPLEKKDFTQLTGTDCSSHVDGTGSYQDAQSSEKKKNIP